MDLNLSFDIDFSDFAESFKPSEPTRYIKPPRRVVQDRNVLYRNAEDFVNSFDLGKNERVFARVSGDFILGDAIEAFVVKGNYHVKRMIVETLSLSQENIDSLHNLLKGDYVDKLDLIVSDYFYSHERHDLIPYIYDQLDIEDKFQLSVIGTHCKICLIETHCGLYFVIHGSGNLRSSGNLEQIIFEESKELFTFNADCLDPVIEKYQTIKKSIRRRTLWQQVAKGTRK